VPGALVREVLASVAQLAVVPLQDLLGLDSSARFNTPGTTSGNWQWRVPAGALGEALAEHCARLNHAFGRA
jgi:4-alpha-glucanotransferase